MIQLDTGGDIARITMTPDEGERFVILNSATIRRLIEVFEDVEQSSAKVLIVTGYGGAFAAGANIKTMYGYSGFDAKGFSILGNRLFRLMRDMPQTVIAQIDGFCLGGGIDFASSCDLRFATAKSRFAHPGGVLGIITGFGGTQKIPRLVRPAESSLMMFTGEQTGAAEMLRAGFLHRVYSSFDELKADVSALAERLGQRQQVFQGTLKRISQGAKIV